MNLFLPCPRFALFSFFVGESTTDYGLCDDEALCSRCVSIYIFVLFFVVCVVVVSYRTAMLDELDFRKEADNIEKFTEFLERAGITDAVAPQVCVCACVWRAQSPLL